MSNIFKILDKYADKYLDPNVSFRDRWEGRDHNWRVAGRIGGGVESIVGVLAISVVPFPFSIPGYLILVDGLGDVFTGKHHYFATRIGRLLTRDRDFPNSDDRR